MHIKSLLTGVAIIGLLAPAGAAHAALVFYNTHGAFTGANPGAALIEDFESFAPKDTSLPTVVTPTITANPIAGGDGNVFVSSPGYTNYDPSGIPTPSSILTANGDEAFEILLATAAGAVGSDIYLNDFGPATISYYSGATLLSSFTFAATPGDKTDNWIFFGAQSDGAAIDRIAFISTDGGVLNTGIDNIMTAAPVPEPATWAFMILGFGMIGGAMRRRKPTVTVSYAL